MTKQIHSIFFSRLNSLRRVSKLLDSQLGESTLILGLVLDRDKVQAGLYSFVGGFPRREDFR